MIRYLLIRYYFKKDLLFCMSQGRSYGRTYKGRYYFLCWWLLKYRHANIFNYRRLAKLYINYHSLVENSFEIKKIRKQEKEK